MWSSYMYTPQIKIHFFYVHKNIHYFHTKALFCSFGHKEENIQQELRQV